MDNLGNDLCKIVLNVNNDCLALFRQTFGYKYGNGQADCDFSKWRENNAKAAEDWHLSFSELIKLTNEINTHDISEANDPICYLAAGYANDLIASSKWTTEEEKSNARIFFTKNYEAYLQNPIQCKDLWYLSLGQIYENLGEAYEKEFEYVKAIKYFELYDSEQVKQFSKPPVATYRKELGKKIKYLSYRSKDSELLVSPSRASSIYLKMGTQCAIDYWKSQMNSPYYENDSYFKICVDTAYSDVSAKHSKGYKYTPKLDKEKFKRIAIENGWR